MLPWILLSDVEEVVGGLLEAAAAGGLTARITDLRHDLRLATAATISRCVWLCMQPPTTPVSLGTVELPYCTCAV
jgi:hypothetical protein